MMSVPMEILTRRLALRPFERTDAPAVARLAGDEAVARDTINIPHPYPAGEAEAWIAAHPAQWRAGDAITFAVTTLPDRELVGAVTLILDPDGDSAELGYWTGRPWWGQGYATEAAHAALTWGFGVLGLSRVHAAHFSRNAASAAVLRKLGMRHHGRLPARVRKAGEVLDLERYLIMAGDFDPARVGRGGGDC